MNTMIEIAAPNKILVIDREIIRSVELKRSLLWWVLSVEVMEYPGTHCTSTAYHYFRIRGDDCAKVVYTKLMQAWTWTGEDGL